MLLSRAMTAAPSGFAPAAVHRPSRTFPQAEWQASLSSAAVVAKPLGPSGPLESQKIHLSPTEEVSQDGWRAPSSTKRLPPAPPSSAGWKNSFTVPFSSFSFALRSLAPPSSIVMWLSCPHAWLFPGTLLLHPQRKTLVRLGKSDLTRKSVIYGMQTCSHNHEAEMFLLHVIAKFFRCI